MSAPTLSKSSSSSSAASAATLEQLLARPAIYDRFASLPPLVDAAGHPVPMVSLFDFNLLARVYTDGAKRFRAHAAPELLRWNWRRARIHELLRQAQSDVICLQEVVQAEFDNVEVRAQKKAAEEARQAAAAEQAAKAAEKKAEMARKAEKRVANKAKVAGAAPVFGDAVVAAAPAVVSAPEAAAAAPASAPASDEQAASAPAAAVAAESYAASGASSNDAAAPATADAASSSAAAAAPLMEDDGDDEVSTEAADPAYVPPAEGDFSTFFTEQGYTWRLQEPAQKADKYPVGVCVAWKTSTFYPEPVVFDSRSRAVIVALKFRAPGALDSDPEPPATLSNTLFVCNVHLQGHYTETSTRLNQVKSLFKQLERHVAELAAGRLGASANGAKSKQDQQERKKKKDKAAKQDAAGAAAPADAEAAAAPAVPAASPSPSPSPAPAAAAGASASLVPMLLLTGDFNQNERFSSVHRLCVDGRVPAGYVDGGTKQVVTASEVSQPWPLQSAYDKAARPEAYPVFSFHNNHYGPLSHYQDVLDFIYSPPSSLPLLGSLAVLSQGQRGEEERRLIDQTSLPNELIPSDHMPVGATFWPKLWHEELQRQEQAQPAQATAAAATGQPAA